MQYVKLLTMPVTQAERGRPPPAVQTSFFTGNSTEATE